MAANVYVDGFNLYKGVEEHVARLAQTGTEPPDHWKWIDLRALGQRLVPGEPINQIRYFTARVKPVRANVSAPQRQDAYLRALQTLPGLSVHFGLFKTGKTRMPLHRGIGPIRELGLRLVGLKPKRYPDGNVSVQVMKTEEKGSDVNLASYLLLDAFHGSYSKAVVISNDTDLCEPVRIVAEEFGLPVMVVTPRAFQPVAKDLEKVASATRKLRLAAVVKSQLPATLADPNGVVHRPAVW